MYPEKAVVLDVSENMERKHRTIYKQLAAKEKELTKNKSTQKKGVTNKIYLIPHNEHNKTALRVKDSGIRQTHKVQKVRVEYKKKPSDSRYRYIQCTYTFGIPMHNRPLDG
uniref:Uncharacterized protein n=1 Tax=Romanomermis culicivorax TaxID=13658 RepID=A0A915I594_ROMCU